MQVDIIATTSLGDRSYVVHDGHDALVVDPQRDLDRVRDVLARQGLRCAAVAETHIHNDYGPVATPSRRAPGPTTSSTPRTRWRSTAAR